MACLLLLLLLLFLVGSSAASNFISADDVLGQQLELVSSHRTLLQIKKACPVDIEKRNYTILTSQCKGPPYPQKPCCDALAQLLCPIADQLNDRTNDCAETLFNYIYADHGYPQGEFASLCGQGSEGLPCPASPPDADNELGIINDDAVALGAGLWRLLLVASLGVWLL